MINKSDCPFLILYEFDQNDPNTKGFIKCKNAKETYDAITKLAIRLCEQANPHQKQFTYKQIKDSLKQIPFFKVYHTESVMGELKETVNFSHSYRQYIKQASSQTQNVYKLLQNASASEQFMIKQLNGLAPLKNGMEKNGQNL